LRRLNRKILIYALSDFIMVPCGTTGLGHVSPYGWSILSSQRLVHLHSQKSCQLISPVNTTKYQHYLVSTPEHAMCQVCNTTTSPYLLIVDFLLIWEIEHNVITFAYRLIFSIRLCNWKSCDEHFTMV